MSSGGPVKGQNNQKTLVWKEWTKCQPVDV